MATENPKVSAYVPQAIKDRLTQFREERNISESQAVTSILAEYFGMTEVLGRSPDEIGGVTLAGMQATEARLASFMEIVEGRLAKLENAAQSKSELSENTQSIDSLPSKPLTEISPQTQSQGQQTSEVSFNLLGEPLEEIKPIPGTKLSKLRFGLPEAAIAGAKRSKSIEKFTQWTRDKDPNHIAWKFVEAPTKGYVPAEELSSELKSKLLKWIKDNL